MMKVYFIASYGNFAKLPIGGGQTAARRLLATLKSLGYDVTAIHRHPPTSQYRWIRGFQFILWTILDPILVFLRLCMKSRDNSMTLYMGYMGNILIPLEWIMSLLTRILGYNNVMYLAGGGTERVYERSNCIQKLFERKMLNNYKLVLTEGYENLEFVKRISATKTGYLPNFTENDFAPTTYPEKSKDRWNFLYFGRICEEKNVLLSIEAFNQICDVLDTAFLTIVGSGPEEYSALVDKNIMCSPYKDRINRVGRTSHEVLKQMMFEQHFFLFPSKEPREGHSNALNEAMSYGLVPIVSDNNFLPSIVCNGRLVVHKMSADVYAKVVIDVINSGDYDELSHEMYERVQSHFIQSVVEKNLKKLLETL